MYIYIYYIYVLYVVYIYIYICSIYIYIYSEHLLYADQYTCIYIYIYIYYIYVLYVVYIYIYTVNTCCMSTSIHVYIYICAICSIYIYIYYIYVLYVVYIYIYTVNTCCMPTAPCPTTPITVSAETIWISQHSSCTVQTIFPYHNTPTGITYSCQQISSHDAPVTLSQQANIGGSVAVFLSLTWP